MAFDTYKVQESCRPCSWCVPLSWLMSGQALEDWLAKANHPAQSEMI